MPAELRAELAGRDRRVAVVLGLTTPTAVCAARQESTALKVCAGSVNAGSVRFLGGWKQVADTDCGTLPPVTSGCP